MYQRDTPTPCPVRGYPRSHIQVEGVGIPGPRSGTRDKGQFSRSQLNQQIALFFFKTMSKLAHQNECKTCGRIFPLESHRTEHERRNHAEIPYMCRTCNWFYEDFTSLQYHSGAEHNFWPSVESSGLYCTPVNEAQGTDIRIRGIYLFLFEQK